MPIGDLFIPRKEQSPVKQPDYSIDMRAIEMWAKTLTSSGGGAGYFEFLQTPQSGGHLVAWGSGTISGGTGTGTPQQILPLPNAPSASVQFLSTTVATAVVASGGFVYSPASPISPGKTIWGAASFQAPNFIGPSPTIGFNLFTQAIAMDATSPATNWFTVNSRQINLASGNSHTLGAGDYLAATIVGTDLQFTGGSLSLKSTAANKQYLVGWSVNGVWDTANTFTGFVPS